MPEALAENWIALLLAGIVGFGGHRLSCLPRPSLYRPGESSEIKSTPYECGIPATPYAFSQINIRYYIFAILFLIFDVEAVFLFPWAVVFMGSNIAFYAMMIFLAVLFFAIVYGWKKGVLEWRK